MMLVLGGGMGAFKAQARHKTASLPNLRAMFAADFLCGCQCVGVVLAFCGMGQANAPGLVQTINAILFHVAPQRLQRERGQRSKACHVCLSIAGMQTCSPAMAH